MLVNEAKGSEEKKATCGEEGHLFRNCPLNYYGPALMVDKSWP